MAYATQAIKIQRGSFYESLYTAISNYIRTYALATKIKALRLLPYGRNDENTLGLRKSCIYIRYS